MLDEVKKYQEEVSEFIADNEKDIEAFRIKFLGQKGLVKKLFAAFKDVPGPDKKSFGQELNALKNAAQEKVQSLKGELSQKATNAHAQQQDNTRPVYPKLGSRHPVSLVRKEMIDIFSRLGFNVSTGPEIEDDWHNFTALNFPEEHPARDMQDTFFVRNPFGEEEFALRTHTSSVQVRVMENEKPPIRTISPGRVFRNEAISARSHCIFHQLEGLYIDQDVSFADMKQTLLYFAREFFGEETKIRLRPSYFPFTEPSAEMDIWWGLETEADYKMTKGTGWLEVLGCGMVDPDVLKNNKIDPEVYAGYAFGIGLERIALFKYQIPDIRMLFENDMRFLTQFQRAL